MGKKNFNLITVCSFALWKDGKRTPLNGMIEPLLDFFSKKSKKVLLIDGPFPGSDQLITKVELYRDGVLIKKSQPILNFPPSFVLKRYNKIQTQPTFKIRDFISSLQVLFLQKEKIDLFIGLESMYTLAGIIMKKLKKIDKVVYYVSDYSPTRYSSPLMNNLYLLLDRFCAKHSDFIWDVSKAMMPARIKAGLKKNGVAPAIHVPNALFPWQIHFLPISKLDPYSVVFAGSIGPENGLDLAIEAVALARKKIPKLKLHIFGGGLKKDEELAKKLIIKLKLQNSVINHGFISDLKQLSNELMHYMIGLAPYRSFSWSVRWYADATKMRLYFASGLPSITTHVPPLGKEAEEKGCAIVVKDKKEMLAEAIIDLFLDKEKYKKYRTNAIEFAKNNTWENTYASACKQMKIL